MQVAGVIAEYNPFHTGHAYQLARTREALGGDCAVVCVMSSSWTQQADCAVADKWLRARLALMGGADLVLELPTLWATASAEGFARGAVGLLHAAGVVDALSFGSECGDAEALGRVAGVLNSQRYREELRRFLSGGTPFAVARQAAVRDILGGDADLLSAPNNNLGVEYLRALSALNSPIRPMTVRRAGASHNAQAAPGGRFTSATHLRQCLRAGAWSEAEPYLAPEALALLRKAPLAQLAYGERAMLYALRAMTAEGWAALPDSAPEEGLPQRLAQAARQAVSVPKFCDLVKTRRYTHARIRRLALFAYLGITRADREQAPAYLRVLGMNGRGREVLREMKGRASLPVLTRPAHIRRLGDAARRQFELEARFTDRYGLCLPQVPPCGREWTEGPAVEA